MLVKSAAVEQEYVKNSDLKKEDVEVLKQWVLRQPHLPEMSELQLILFLQSCYCNLEHAKKTIDAFFLLKKNCPDFFANRDPNNPRTKKSMDCGCFCKLPNVTPEGYNMLLFTFMDGDASKFNFVDLVKIFDMNMKLWLEEEGTSQGLFIVLDVEKFTFGHLTRIGIFALRDVLMYLQEALPVRLKGLYLVNSGAVIDKLLVLAKPFLKQQLLDMLHVHRDVSENLFKFIPQKCLPKDYGGSMDSVSVMHDAMKTKLLASADYLIKEEKQMADESKRTEDHNDSIIQGYGIEGSFKKLEID